MNEHDEQIYIRVMAVFRVLRRDFDNIDSATLLEVAIEIVHGGLIAETE